MEKNRKAWKNEEMLKNRAKIIFDLAKENNIDHLILGGWGCGVFKCPPQLVANTLIELCETKTTFAFLDEKLKNIFAQEYLKNNNYFPRRINVFGKNVNGCKEYKKDIMIRFEEQFFNSIYHRWYLTQKEAEELHKNLGQAIERNKS